MGISEMWPLSLLLLHTKLNGLFPSFVPLLDEFTLGDENVNNNNTNTITYSNITRSNNHNNIYRSFKATALSKYLNNLKKQNGLGIIITASSSSSSSSS